MEKSKIRITKLPMLIDSYFNVYLRENTSLIADVEGLAAYLGITRDELFSLEGNAKYGRCVSIAKTRIAAIKKQLAYRGKIPVALLTFDLKSDHGYRDKPDDTPSSITVFKGNVLDWGV